MRYLQTTEKEEHPKRKAVHEMRLLSTTPKGDNTVSRRSWGTQRLKVFKENDEDCSWRSEGLTNGHSRVPTRLPDKRTT